jgi:hypothetical protein
MIRSQLLPGSGSIEWILAPGLLWLMDLTIPTFHLGRAAGMLTESHSSRLSILSAIAAMAHLNFHLSGWVYSDTYHEHFFSMHLDLLRSFDLASLNGQIVLFSAIFFSPLCVISCIFMAFLWHISHGVPLLPLLPLLTYSPQKTLP